jgi:dephospho-CoA kinase
LLFVGLTGGIGSGKSEALAACELAGAAVLSSDQVVHDLLSTEKMRDQLAARWGEKVFADETVDREAVAEIVFAEPTELSWLESVLFPLVGERIEAWREGLEQSENGPEVAVVEVPLLFEAGIEGVFDATVAVVAPEEVRSDRAGGRAHRALGGRLARQLSQDEKASRADHVIENNGTLQDLEQKVRELIGKLTAKSAGAKG